MVVQTDLVGFKNSEANTKIASKSVLNDENRRSCRKTGAVVAAPGAVSFSRATQMLKEAQDRVNQRIVGRMLMARVNGGGDSDSTLTKRAETDRKYGDTPLNSQQVNGRIAVVRKQAMALPTPGTVPQQPPQPQYPPQQAMYPAAALQFRIMNMVQKHECLGSSFCFEFPSAF